MTNIIKLTTTVSILTVAAFLLSSCGKASESGNKYPSDFPKECITAYDNKEILVKKLRATGRFDEDALAKHENANLILDAFYTSPKVRYKNTSKEEYITACMQINSLQLIRLNKLEKIQNNIDQISDDELQQAMGIYTKNSTRR